MEKNSKIELEDTNSSEHNCLTCFFVESGFAKGAPTWTCRNLDGNRIAVKRKNICKKYKNGT